MEITGKLDLESIDEEELVCKLFFLKFLWVARNLSELSNESLISASIEHNSTVKSLVLHLGRDLRKILDPLGPHGKVMENGCFEAIINMGK